MTHQSKGPMFFLAWFQHFDDTIYQRSRSGYQVLRILRRTREVGYVTQLADDPSIFFSLEKLEVEGILRAMSFSRGSKRGCLRDIDVIAGCIFLATFVCYFERMGFSIAFTELAELEKLNEAIKGRVMSSFFYGYASMQLPGGWLSANYGGTRTLQFSFAMWGIISLFFIGQGSVSANDTNFLAACRVAIGASQGLFIPASHTLLAQWVPAHERSRLVTLAMSGM